METTIGILAYGSLINEPGSEIAPLIIERISCVTPFNVEYARMSKSRDYAPTLIPIENEGAQVNGVILVLDKSISIEEAENMLWRREIREADTNKKYKKKANPGKDSVQVRTLENFEGINKVIYTSIASNLGVNSPNILADLAIKSILNDAGDKQMDGIRYLLNAKSNGIVTPLSDEYEKNILEYTQTQSLEEAIAKLDNQRPLQLKKKDELNKFEDQVIEIADLICHYGFDKTVKDKKFNPSDFKNFIEQNREAFIKNCHEGFKKAQQKILALMLAFEVEKYKLKLVLKSLDNEKNKSQVLELNASVIGIESKEHILRHLIDTIAWQMIKGQLYIARRLYQDVKGEKRLLKSNIASVIRAADEINKNDLDFALITDLSAYIQSGDIMIMKENKSLEFVEVKEGVKNQEIFKILEDIINSDEPLEKIIDNLKLDGKSIKQLDRNLKQLREMINLTNILNNDKGVDKSGKSVKIITPREDTPKFDDKLRKLQKQLEARNLWAYDVIEDCLHIALYKGPLKFIGPSILDSIGQHSGNNFIIMDFLHVIRSLNKPLLFLPFSKDFLFDILFGRTKLFFMLNIDQYLMLFSNYGLKAEWLSRKETMKIVDNQKNSGLFIYKNRGIKITDEATKKIMYLNVGIFSKMYFEHIYPSYTAYTCRYLLEVNNDST